MLCFCLYFQESCTDPVKMLKRREQNRQAAKRFRQRWKTNYTNIINVSTFILLQLHFIFWDLIDICCTLSIFVFLSAQNKFSVTQFWNIWHFYFLKSNIIFFNWSLWINLQYLEKLRKTILISYIINK